MPVGAPASPRPTPSSRPRPPPSRPVTRAARTATPRPSSAGSPSAPPTSTNGCPRWPPGSGSHVAADRPLGTLSGGQAARACLVAVLLSQYDVLLLDEPTNDLDARGLTLMADFVRAHEGPILIASHDRTFLDAVATSVVELDVKQQRIGHYTGGWSAFVEQRQLARAHAWEAYEGYAAERDSLLAQSRQRHDWADRGRRNVALGTGARQAHPREAQGPGRPPGREGRPPRAGRRPTRRRGAAAQGVAAALRHHRGAPLRRRRGDPVRRGRRAARLPARPGQPRRRSGRPHRRRRRERLGQDDAARRPAR